MTIVKGTRQHRVKVIEDRPLLRRAMIVGWIGLALLAVTLSYQRGFSVGIAGQETALEQLAGMQTALDMAQRRTLELEQQVANVNLGAEVDKKANEEIRREVISLKEKIALLQEENSFYRGLMAPTKNQRGLTFGAVELSQTERPRIYGYKVVMQQLATNHQLLNGSLRYTVVGRAAGEDVAYSLNQLSDSVSAESIKLRFKYFQTIEGQLILPEGFEPLGIELLARSTGKNSVTVEKRFGWLVEEVL